MNRLFISVILIIAFLINNTAAGQTITKYSESASNFNGTIELSSNSYPVSDMYRAYKKARTGFKSIQSIRESVEKKIADFATKQGKSFVILGQRSSNPPYIAGNYPRVEIIFVLINK